LWTCPHSVTCHRLWTPAGSHPREYQAPSRKSLRPRKFCLPPRARTQIFLRRGGCRLPAEIFLIRIRKSRSPSALPSRGGIHLKTSVCIQEDTSLRACAYPDLAF